MHRSQNPLHKNTQAGFTIVEVIVTTIVVTLFVTTFFQSYILLESQRVNILRQAKASDIADINLSKYPTIPSGLNCSTDMDLVANPDAVGTLIGVSDDTNPTTYAFTAEDASTLGTDSLQKITAYAPNGCDGTTDFKDGIVKLVSTVEYNGSNGKVSHASFVH